MEPHNTNLKGTIDSYTESGNAHLIDAKSKGGDKSIFNLAIQDFVLAYKHSLLLNANVQQRCFFNLGASYIAAEYYGRGIEILKNILSTITGQSTGNPKRGDILFNIAYAYEGLKDYDNAIQFYKDALFEHRVNPTTTSSVPKTLLSLAKLYGKLQDHSQARTFYDEAVSHCMKNQNFELACDAYLHKVDIMIGNGYENQECKRALEDCLDQALKLKDPDTKGKLVSDIGLKLASIGEYENALRCFDGALRLYGKDNILQRALLLQNMGAIYNRLKVYKVAVKHHKECIDLYGLLGNRSAQGQCFCNLAFAQSQQKDYEAARESYQHALRAFKDIGDLSGQWQVYEGLAAVSRIFCNIDQAILYYKRAIAIQALAPNVSSTHQDRLIDKLSSTLRIRHQLLPDEDDHPLRLTLQQQRPESRRKLLDRNSDVRPNRLAELKSSENITVVDGGSAPHPPTPMKRESTRQANEEIISPSKAPVIGLPDVSPKQHKPRKPFRRGRRGYGKGGKRPIQQVARGLSTVTELSRASSAGFSLELGSDNDSPIRLRLPFVSSDDSGEDDEGSEDGTEDSEDADRTSPELIRYNGRVYSVSPELESVSRKIKKVADAGKKWHKNGRNIRIEVDEPHESAEQTPSKKMSWRPTSAVRRQNDPNHKISSLQKKAKTNSSDDGNDGLLSIPGSDAEDKPNDRDGASALNETDYESAFRKQLELDEEAISEDEVSDYVASSNSSRRSSADYEEDIAPSKKQAVYPNSMPAHTAPKPPHKPPRSPRTYEHPLPHPPTDGTPLYSQSLKKSVAFSPNAKQSDDSTHLYESLPTRQTPVEDQPGSSGIQKEEHEYDQPASTLHQETDSDSESAPPLSSLMQQGYEPNAASDPAPSNSTSKKSRSPNDTLPSSPEAGPQVDEKSNNEKSKKQSKACVIM